MSPVSIPVTSHIHKSSSDESLPHGFRFQLLSYMNVPLRMILTQLLFEASLTAKCSVVLEIS